MDKDPFRLFQIWSRLAKKNEPNDFDAAALATSGLDHMPDNRMVLIRHADLKGFVFFTHRHSAKGVQIEHNKNAALCFHWKSIRRQIRIRGAVHIISDLDADYYFSSRPRDHQINAHASKQSKILTSRQELIAQFAKWRKKFARKPIPRPSHWIGYRLVPSEIEFWQSKRSRLHERTLFTRKTPNTQWRVKKLFP